MTILYITWEMSVVRPQQLCLVCVADCLIAVPKGTQFHSKRHSFAFSSSLNNSKRLLFPMKAHCLSELKLCLMINDIVLYFQHGQRLICGGQSTDGYWVLVNTEAPCEQLWDGGPACVTFSHSGDVISLDFSLLLPAHHWCHSCQKEKWLLILHYDLSN